MPVLAKRDGVKELGAPQVVLTEICSRAGCNSANCDRKIAMIGCHVEI